MTNDATSDPTTTIPTTDDPYTSSYPMPPSPKAEPFIPALSVPATATTTPRDRAYTLHLQGYRSPAIAAHLHVPERTIRHWIQLTNQEINALPALDSLDALSDATDPDQQPTATASTDPAVPPLPAAGAAARATPGASSDPQGAEQPQRAARGQGERSTPASLTTLQHQRTLAIERHRARSAAAWALHDQLRATLDPFLARLSERLLLHTQYPDDADHVSMSTLALAGGPLSPAFRAMYHLLPGIIHGLTRALALAERADLQLDRLLAIVPPAPTQSPAPKAAPTSSTPPTQQEPVKRQPTSEEFRRAAHAARLAAEDAYVIPRLTQRQRDLIRAYSALPDPLPEGPMETWNSTIDPNAPLTRWREVLLPHGRRLTDPDDPCDLDDDSDDDDPDDDPDPTPPSGNESDKNFGDAIGSHARPMLPSPAHGGGAGGGGPSGNPSDKRSASPRPHHQASNRPRTPTTDGGKETGKKTGKATRTDAPTTSGNRPDNSGNASGNKSGNRSGKKAATSPASASTGQPARSSPYPSPRRRTLRRPAGRQLPAGHRPRF